MSPSVWLARRRAASHSHRNQSRNRIGSVCCSGGRICTTPNVCDGAGALPAVQARASVRTKPAGVSDCLTIFADDFDRPVENAKSFKRIPLQPPVWIAGGTYGV
ncbi:MAG: hypothetical protein CMJ59_00640 [Planctomycetaceae bacterium]|nr:hypothetical protein [Planctomycetaceae bacterium]